MTVWAIIPARASGIGKTRLAGALTQGERATLSHAMLAQVVAAAGAATNVDRVFVLGTTGIGLPGEPGALADPGGGLNAAVGSALATALAGGATRVVFVAGDLPQLTSREVELLAAAPSGSIGIAPDRHGTGTNALSLALPAAAGFAFAFGPDSYARHHAEAQRLGLAVEAIHSPGLARDVDVPEDLPDAANLIDRSA